MRSALTIAASVWHGSGCILGANRYAPEMVWFVNERDARSQRIGLDCRREDGAYVLTVVDPDGSETRATFDDEDTMIVEAVRIHLGLVNRTRRADIERKTIDAFTALLPGKGMSNRPRGIEDRKRRSDGLSPAIAGGRPFS